MHFPNGTFRQSVAHIEVPRYKNRKGDKTTSLDSAPVQTSSTLREGASKNDPAAAQTCPDPGFLTSLDGLIGTRLERALDSNVTQIIVDL